MEKLLNSKKEKLTKTQQILKLRREMFKLVQTTPTEIKQFCIKLHEYDKHLLQQFILELNYNENLKNYLKKNDIIWKYKYAECGLDCNLIVDFILNLDDIYKKSAKIIAEKTGFFSLEILYKVINYIDDNVPIKINKELAKEEITLIKFLLYKGDIKTFSQKYNISNQRTEILIKNICNKFNCNNINSVLNFVLIKKYEKQ